jgi:hypothetical protein
MLMMLTAAAFVRRSGAFGLGHVGWCFALDATEFREGGVENPPGTPITPPDEDGFWSCDTSVTALTAPFVPLGYDYYKLLVAPNGNPQSATQCVLWIRQQWYFVLGRNCMDDVYDVLQNFGVPNLPLPILEWTPNRWFDDLPGVAIPVSREPTTWLFREKSHVDRREASSPYSQAVEIRPHKGEGSELAESPNCRICEISARD